MQFSAVCLNLLGEQKAANYLVTGSWSRFIADEAAKHCRVNVVCDTKQNGHTSMDETTWVVDANADYFHYVDNETADGFECINLPFERIPASQPVVCDMSSSLLTRTVDWSKYGMVYAGAQKQAGIASLCIAIIREDLISRN